jgi:hypothetical protein
MQEFGIGPGSRTKVSVLPEEDEDDPVDQKVRARRFLA